MRRGENDQMVRRNPTTLHVIAIAMTTTLTTRHLGSGPIQPLDSM